MANARDMERLALDGRPGNGVETVDTPMFTHRVTGEVATMAVMSPQVGRASIHLILWERIDEPDEFGMAHLLCSNRTICGKYTGDPAGCRVELMAEDNAPEDAEICETCRGFDGSN